MNHHPLTCRVNWQFTSLRVLATEWVDGLKITEQPKAVNHAHVAVGVEAFAVARPTESDAGVDQARCKAKISLAMVHLATRFLCIGCTPTPFDGFWWYVCLHYDPNNNRNHHLYLHHPPPHHHHFKSRHVPHFLPLDQLSAEAMILDVGVVHADPHPGNFIVTRVQGGTRRQWAESMPKPCLLWFDVFFSPGRVWSYF